MVSPVVLKSKLIQRAALTITGETKSVNWDELLPQTFTSQWKNWLKSLSGLQDLSLQRSYTPQGFGDPNRCDLHTFTDSSDVAIGAVYSVFKIDKPERCCLCIVCY